MNYAKLFCAAAVLTIACVSVAQVADAPDEVKAGIPVNYTEAKVGSYILPDPLKLADGKAVSSPKMWFEKRRPRSCGCSRIASMAACRTAQGI